MDQVGVDRAHHGGTRFQTRPQLRVIPHQPLQFRGGEIGVHLEARAGMHQRFRPGGDVARAKRLPAPALPDHGRMQRTAAAAFEDHHGLALVGQAQAGDFRDPPGVTRHEGLQNRERVAPDLLRIVLDPARLGIVLSVIPALAIQDPAGGFEEQRLGG
jgi:hypothetical protein